MSWKSEFGKDYEIPGFLDYLAKDCRLVEDSSWHNDTAPSFSAADEDFNGVRLWVEHPLKSEREASFGTRFCVSSQEEGAQVGEDFETDSIEDALEEFFKRGIEAGVIDEQDGTWRELYDEYKKSLLR